MSQIGLELNGPANIVMLIDSHTPASPIEAKFLCSIRLEALKTISYMKGLKLSEKPAPWHTIEVKL